VSGDCQILGFTLWYYSHDRSACASAQLPEDYLFLTCVLRSCLRLVSSLDYVHWCKGNGSNFTFLGPAPFCALLASYIQCDHGESVARVVCHVTGREMQCRHNPKFGLCPQTLLPVCFRGSVRGRTLSHTISIHPSQVGYNPVQVTLIIR
jgi:hypothetical protein